MASMPSRKPFADCGFIRITIVGNKASHVRVRIFILRVFAPGRFHLQIMTFLHSGGRIMEPRIYRAICMMTSDLRREIPIDELGKRLNISASRLRHLFKDELGISPHRFLKSRRLQKAKELLESTFLNVEQIMLEVGIKDRSHFVRDFKRAFSYSPTQYRTQYLISAQEKEVQAIAKTAAL
jgi:transcriptional regulator GlxA family with amidase domain